MGTGRRKAQTAAELRERIAALTEQAEAQEQVENAPRSENGRPICQAEGCENETHFASRDGHPVKWCSEHRQGASDGFRSMLADQAEAQFGEAVRSAEAAAGKAKGTGEPVTVEWAVTTTALGYLLVEQFGAEQDKARKSAKGTGSTVTIRFPSAKAADAAYKALYKAHPAKLDPLDA